jgi:hypothetical protein
MHQCFNHAKQHTRGGQTRKAKFSQQIEPLSCSKKIGSLTGTVVNHDREHDLARLLPNPPKDKMLFLTINLPKLRISFKKKPTGDLASIRDKNVHGLHKNKGHFCP